MQQRPEGDGISRIAVLGEPTRRALYDLVRRASAGVGRDEAAAVLGIGRSLAAFHLDRLVAAGLLGVEFRRLNGRSGPGAGRPAKVYTRGDTEVTVSLPERRYAFAAALVAEALERVSPGGAPGELLAAARREGVAAGHAYRGGLAGKAARAGTDVLIAALRDSGYDPVREPTGDAAGSIALRNCPFDALSRQFRDLACPMNAAFLEGMFAGLGNPALRLLQVPDGDEQPRGCCVAVQDARGRAARQHGAARPRGAAPRAAPDAASGPGVARAP
jgi:predicted ArsR family transcriptional regulator